MAVSCFVAGTLIRRPEGEVAVETLQVGDLVLTSSGEARPVKRIGHRNIDCRAHANASAIHPVRIAVDAFGPNRPSEDLFVSPGHSIAVDLCGEVLIPAAALVNGSTVAEVAVDEVSYWHVELDSHDILFANNLPAESCLDVDNRGFFEKAGAGLDAFDAGAAKSPDDLCRPIATEGSVLAFVRTRLAARAEAIGWAPMCDPNLRLIVDGKTFQPLTGSDSAVFLFPAGSKDVRLVSDIFVPASLGGPDKRQLGACLYGLTLAGSFGEPRRISLADARLGEGLYGQEVQGGVPVRWSRGELPLDPGLWAELAGQISLLVSYDSTTTRQWTAPARAAEGHAARREPKLYSVR
jgi:hypothetical protein